MSLWGDSELSIRSPNLFAHLLFLIFSYLIVKRFLHPLLIIGSFIVLNTNPFVLEFFGLARGYGLAMAFMLGSVYFLIRHMEVNPKVIPNKYILLSFLFSMAAVLANYTMLNFHIALIMGILLHYFKHQKGSQDLKIVLKKNALLIRLNLLFALLLLPILFRLKLSGMLFVGGTQSFHQDTVKSLVNASLYLEDYGRLNEVLFIIIPILFLTATLVILVAAKQKKTASYFAIPVYLLIFSALSTIAQFYLLKTPFLFQRTAVFLLPLYLLLISFFSRSLHQLLSRFRILSLATISFLAITCTIHLLNTINIDHTYTYPSSANVKDMLASLDQMRDKQDSSKINIGASHSLVSPLNYYRVTRNYSYLNPIGYNFTFHKGFDKFYSEKVETGNYDYLYFTEEDKTIIKEENLEVISYYPSTKTYFTRFKKNN